MGTPEIIGYTIGLIVIIYYIFFKILPFAHAHWHHLISDFSFSSKEFYKLLRAELYKNEIKGIQFENVKLKEGNVFSSKREYLRIRWKEFHFDICAAPFGTGFFISWWHIYRLGFFQVLLYIIPYIGPWLVRKLFTITYYKIDTATMFMKMTHLAVLNVLDELTTQEGIQFLDDDERKPILNDIFKR